MNIYGLCNKYQPAWWIGVWGIEMLSENLVLFRRRDRPQLVNESVSYYTYVCKSLLAIEKFVLTTLEWILKNEMKF